MAVHRVHKRRMDEEWFRARKKALKVTNEMIAAQINRDVSIVSKVLTRKIPFSLDYVQGFARALDVSRQEILTRAGIIEGDIGSNAQTITFEGATSDDPRPNLPVYGTALGSNRSIRGEAIEQTTLNKSEVIEFAKRPTLLNRRKDSYGLYIQGSSMHPALPDGEMVAVVPNMPLSIGDNVVVYLRPSEPEEDDGATARAVLVKELVRRSASHVVLRQYSPPADFQIDMDDVLRIDRVLTRREMLS